jgi:hypothetical protein
MFSDEIEVIQKYHSGASSTFRSISYQCISHVNRPCEGKSQTEYLFSTRDYHSLK